MDNDLFGKGYSEDLNSDIFFRIQNFRSIEDVNLTLTDKVILVGKNNSGKSNIMLAIYKSVKGEDVEKDDFNNKSLPIRVSIKYKGIDYITEVNYDEDKKMKFSFQEKNPPFNIVYLKALPDFDDATSSVKTKVLGQILDAQNDITALDDEELERKISELSKEIAEEENKKFAPVRNEILTSLTRCDNSIKYFEYEPLSITSNDFLKNRNILITDDQEKRIDWKKMGHGTRRLLLMLFYGQLARYSKKIKTSGKKSSINQTDKVIVMIEEPEIFMHPQQQRAVANELYNYFISSEIESDYKLMVSTHSPYFIDECYLDTLRIIKKSNGLTRIHNDGKPIDKYNPNFQDFESDFKNGTRVIDDEIELKDLLGRIRQEPETKEIFFASKVLVVEGDNERLAIAKLLEITNKHFLFSENISILNAHTNSEIINFIKLLDDFEISFIIAMDDDNGKSDTSGVIKIIRDWLTSKGFIIEDKFILFKGDFCNSLSPESKKAFGILKRVVNITKEEINENLNNYLSQIIEKLKK